MNNCFMLLTKFKHAFHVNMHPTGLNINLILWIVVTNIMIKCKHTVTQTADYPSDLTLINQKIGHTMQNYTGQLQDVMIF